MKFLDFTKEIVNTVQPFSKVVSHIQMNTKEDGTVKVAVPSVDHSIEIYAESKKPLSDFSSRACLGSIPYLHQVLNERLMEKAKVDLNTTMQDGKDYLKSMHLTGSKLDVFYSATNPFIQTIRKPTKMKDQDWIVAFVVDAESVKELSPIRRLGTAAGANSEELFQLSCTEDTIQLQFGGSAHSIDYELTNQVEFLGKRQTISPTLFYVDTFFRLLDMTSKHDSLIMFSKKALKFEFETDRAIYEIVTTAKHKPE